MSEADEEDVADAVVIDFGSSLVRAGWSGYDEPDYENLSIVGHPRHKGCFGSYPDRYYFGRDARIKRGVLNLYNPISRGIVSDWHNFELLSKHTFSEGLNICTDEYPVLLSEPFYNPQRNREKTAELFFESIGVPKYTVESSSLLALISSGRSSGCVLDVGYESTRCVGINDCVALEGAAKHADFGGRSLTERMFECLRDDDMSKNCISEHLSHLSWQHSPFFSQIMEPVKVQFAYAALDYDAELKRFAALSTESEENFVKEELEMDKSSPLEIDKSSRGCTVPYGTFVRVELPDGNELDVGAARFKCAEALFRPSLLGLDDVDGVDKMILRIVAKCDDVDLQSNLYENVVCAGGTSLTKQFSDRLEKSLTGDPTLMAHVLTPHMLLRSLRRCGVLPASTTALRREYNGYMTRTRERAYGVVAPPNRQNATWSGGSIVAKLYIDNYSENWITREQYDEFGASRVLTRFLPHGKKRA